MCTKFTFIKNNDSNSLKFTQAISLGENRLICFISISKLGNFKDPFVPIAKLPQLHSTFIQLLLQQHQQLKTMKMNKAYLDLLLRDIYVKYSEYQPIQFSNNCRNTKFEDISPWNIS